MQFRCGQNDPKNAVKSRLDLLALAKTSAGNGDERLYEFVLNKNEKKLQELVDTVWEMETATEELQRAKMTRVEILQQQLSVVCICRASCSIVPWRFSKTTPSQELFLRRPF